MSITPADSNGMKPKSFWQNPKENWFIIYGRRCSGIGYGLFKLLPILLSMALTSLQLAGVLLALGALIYLILDPKFRNLVFYAYKSVMRFITGLFVQIDPIGILETYIGELRDNLRKMDKQISILRAQMRKLKDIIDQNAKDIQATFYWPTKPKTEKDAMMILKTRKAGRLQESNLKLEDLYKKMEILYRVLTKMYDNSEVLMEDVIDQVSVKKQERAAIRASHSAMKSAWNILSGNSDKRYMFDQAMEAVADDVSMKIGEMEHFMDVSSNFMDSIDLQNGVFEEEGLKMLDKWEKEGVSLLLGTDKDLLVKDSPANTVDLDAPLLKSKGEDHSNQYNNLFNF
ncbi:MAG: hypothetical protein IPP53_03240 [Bacteroidetes bacterium]|nr:hypothetical protein [Bacteroidota bacterium]